jgi:E3 ubiquitin-protein ligase MARCH5
MSQNTEGASINPPESTTLPETTENTSINPEVEAESVPLTVEVVPFNTDSENALLGEIHEESDDETEVLESSSSEDSEDEDLEEFTDGSDFDAEEYDLSYSSEYDQFDDSPNGTLDEMNGVDLTQNRLNDADLPSQVTEVALPTNLQTANLLDAAPPQITENTTTLPSSEPTENNQQLNQQASIPSIEERMCWICLSPNDYSELDDTDKLDLKNYSSWIHPCKCRGTQAWVHQACLRRWIDMKQEGDLMKKVKCSQCKHVYHFSRPPVSKVIKYGRRMVDISQTVSMLSSAATAASGVLYFVSGVGWVIAIRVCGQKHMVRVTRDFPLRSFLTFVAIAPTLVWSRKCFQWEAPVMKLVAKITESTKEEYDCTVNRIERTLAPSFNSSRARCVFGALATPFLGSYIGEKLFNTAKDWWNEKIGRRVLRCLAGSAIFISAKMVLKMIYLYQQNEMHKHSRISNYKKRSKTRPTTSSQTITRFPLPTF